MQRRLSMFDTRNDLPANTRTKVIELLNARLADAIDLGTQSKHAHWNVKGPSFIADRKSTRLNSSHSQISYAVFCLKKKKQTNVMDTLCHLRIANDIAQCTGRNLALLLSNINVLLET